MTFPKERAFGDATPLPTLFRVSPQAKGVEVLGHYEGTRDAALAVRRGDGWTSVFCGSTTISTSVLREIARAAGAHIWLDTGDVVIASPALVAVHVATPGDKTLAIPRGLALRDPWTGATFSDEVRVNVQHGETRIFLIQEPKP